MGGHLLVTQPANMTRILLLSMLASGMAMSTRQEIQMDMEKFNNDAMCWGVENMMYYRLAQYQAMEECSKYGQFSTLPAPANNPFTTLPGDAKNPWMNVPQPVDSRRNPLAKLFNRNSNSNSDKWANLWSDFLNGRSKRQAEEGGLLEIDEAAKLEMLDSALQVNLKLWTTDVWQQLDLKKTLAGEDPEWRQKMIGGYTDCYQVASNWPQQSLDRNPITKVFGRHMIFFKCAMKQEKKMCGMAQMYSWLKTLYGDSDDFNWSQFGLPQDKYDRAALTIMVQTQAASKEERFINDFFVNDEL